MVKKREDKQTRLEDCGFQITTNKILVSTISKRCTHCDSDEFAKDGSRKTRYRGIIQIYRCNKCHRKFTLSPFPRTHFPAWVYEKILSLSAEGNRVKSIAQEIETTAKQKGINLRISHTTVLYVLKDLVSLLIKIEEEYQHNVLAKTWQIDDCFQKLPHRQWAYITNVMAVETRYWLASSVSIKRDTQASKDALEQAVLRAGYCPVEIRCDGLRSHAAAIKKVLRHVYHFSKKKKDDIAIVNYLERLNRTMRRVILKGKCYPTEELLQTYANLIRLQYNFLEKHASLEQKTPAKAAGIQISIRSWKDMVILAIKYKKRGRLTRQMTLHQCAQSISKTR